MPGERFEFLPADTGIDAASENVAVATFQVTNGSFPATFSKFHPLKTFFQGKPIAC